MDRRTILPFTSGRNASLLVALGVVFYLPARTYGQSSGLADVADLVLRRVSVETTKSNGESWDSFGGRPDLRVGMVCGARRYKSPVKSDAYTHDFKAKSLRVRPGDIVEIVVRDQDAAVDDEIGRIRVTITAEQIHAGAAVWTAFGRVKELNVDLKR
jgi:hypothetical protein